MCVFLVSEPIPLAAALAGFHCCWATLQSPAPLVSISYPPSTPLALGDSSLSFPRKPPPSALSSPSMSGKSTSPSHPKQASPLPPVSQPFPRPQPPPHKTVSSPGPGSNHSSPTLASSAGKGLGDRAPRGAPGFPLPLGRGQRGAGPGSGD